MYVLRRADELNVGNCIGDSPDNGEKILNITRDYWADSNQIRIDVAGNFYIMKPTDVVAVEV